jgi:hypothetical protein
MGKLSNFAQILPRILIGPFRKVDLELFNDRDSAPFATPRESRTSILFTHVQIEISVSDLIVEIIIQERILVMFIHCLNESISPRYSKTRQMTNQTRRQLVRERVRFPGNSDMIRVRSDLCEQLLCAIQIKSPENAKVSHRGESSIFLSI